MTHVGVDCGGTEVSREEYEELLAVIQDRPVEARKGFRLKEDLTWEGYDLPEVSEEIGEAEALEILLGGGV